MQECGHHINISGVSKFSSAFAVSEVGSFPVAWAERGWMRDIFCTCFLKALPIPLLCVLPCWGPVICFLAGTGKIAALGLNLHPSCSPVMNGNQISTEGYSPSWNAGWGCCSRRKSHSCTWAPLCRDISGHWDTEPGHPQESLLKKPAFAPLSVWEPKLEYVGLKKQSGPELPAKNKWITTFTRKQDK